MFWLRTLVGLKRSESAAASRTPGVAWAMVGNYDRPWFVCEIFGQIRYMSGASGGKKFDGGKYIWQRLGRGLFD